MSQKAVTDLVSDALNSSGGNNEVQYETVDSVEEMTDTSKSYVLSTTGTVWSYGETTVEVEPPNKFVPSAATFGSRLSASSGSVSGASGSVGSFVTDFISLSDYTVHTPYNVRLNFEPVGSGENKVVFYDSSKARVGATLVGIGDDGAFPNTTISNGETIIDIKTPQSTSSVIPADAAYVRFQLFVKPSGTAITSADIANLTITFDHEDGTKTEYAWYDTGMSPSGYITVDSIDEMTDTNKQYVLNSTGTLWACRTETGVKNTPNFTNLIKFDADGNPSNVTLNYRLNSSGTMSTMDGSFVINDYISTNGTVADKIYMNRLPAAQSKTTHYSDTSGTLGGLGNNTLAVADWTQENDYYFANAFTSVLPSNNYFKFSSGLLTTALTNDSLKGLIVTHDEPITYTETEETISEWYDTGVKPSASDNGGNGNYVTLLVKVNENKNDINELNNRVTALETGSDSITIPTFWQTAVDACIAKIKALQIGRNCITFPFFSDNHQRNGYAGMLIAYIMKECNIPYCFYGGDSISNGTIADEAEMIAQDKAFDTIMSYIPNGRLCRAVGNHDGYWYDGTNKYWYNRDQVYELFLREESIAQNKHFGDDGTYYYVDDIASKVRFIILNTNEVDSTQLTWLQNTALSFNESGWAVVFISHQPISNHYHALISNAAEVRTVVKNYIDGSDTNKADVVGWFSGHIHRDRMWTGEAVNTSDDSQGTEMGFTQITITSDATVIAYDDATKHPQANDDQSHAIDFVTINKTTKTVNLTRLGIGNDRSYMY